MSPALEDDAFEAAHAAARAKRRKAIWIIVGILAAMLGLIAFAFMKDEPPPDVSDLHVPRLNPPDEQNAYALLTSIALALPPEPAEDTEAQQQFARITEGKVVWDQAVMSAGLAIYDPNLADAVTSALEAPFTEAPEIKDAYQLMPEVGGMRRIAQILTRRARLAHHAGDHAAAAELNLLVIRLGDRLAASKGGVIQALTGTAIQSIATESIRTHIDSDSVSAIVLRDYVSRLSDHEIGVEDYYLAYKLEHRMFTGGIDDVKRTHGGTGMISTGKKTGAYLMTLPGVFQPNRTRRWHAEIIRTILADPLPPQPKGGPSEVDQLLQSITEAPWPSRAQNLTGRILLGIAVSHFGKLTTTNHRGRAQHRLTCIYAALRLHQLENRGALPDTLDALVPVYLPTVPLDPFDGQPLRYDGALTSIWSIDQNRLTITDVDGELPRGAPAQRLRFARPPEPLPTFEEYQTHLQP